MALLVLLAGSSQAAAATPSPAEARYAAMLPAAQAGDPAVDWQALRFAYADANGPELDDDGLNPVRKTMIAARQSHDWPAVLAASKTITDKDFVDAQAHLLALVAHKLLGQAAEAEREHTIALGLLKSIETGDGLSAAAPFTVISVREEYQLISARQRRVTKQSLLNQSGHAYDVMETVAGDGDVKTFYFLIDRVLASENAQFTPKPSVKSQ